MNPFGLQENHFGNVTCFDEKTGKIIMPDGFVITKLTTSQLKKLKIPTFKGCLGFVRSHGFTTPTLANFIRIEDEPKAIEYQQKFYIKTTYGINGDWLFS